MWITAGSSAALAALAVGFFLIGTGSARLGGFDDLVVAPRCYALAAASTAFSAVLLGITVAIERL
jgi:hypothetical protein